MASNTTGNTFTPGRPRPVAKVLVATTAMLAFISFWRAAAIVLNDLASSAYYAGGEAEQFIGKTAPWFILGIMLFSYAVRSRVRRELQHVRPRRRLPRGEGSARRDARKILRFGADVRLRPHRPDQRRFRGAISGRRLQRAVRVRARPVHLNDNATAAAVAITVTLYFWWENIKGVPESSEKALRIMQLTTVMVVVLIAWCGYTL